MGLLGKLKKKGSKEDMDEDDDMLDWDAPSDDEEESDEADRTAGYAVKTVRLQDDPEDSEEADEEAEDETGVDAPVASAEEDADESEDEEGPVKTSPIPPLQPH